MIVKVPSFTRDHDAGSMAMLALEAALAVQGENRPAWWLAGISGDAFKFVYDPAAVFEPLRDRNPVDVLTIACRAAGWDGHWSIGAQASAAEIAVRESVRKGRPVLAPFLGEAWYHGVVLVVGIDEGERRFHLQIARTDHAFGRDYETIAIPRSWDGPVPGDIAWADAPLFILDDRTLTPSQEQVVGEALTRAISLHAGTSQPYADHPGARRYSAVPLAGRAAGQGEAALLALRDDIVRNEIVRWDLIWRVDAQLGQLHYDRCNAARFLRWVADGHRAGTPLLEAANGYAATAAHAKRLQGAYWDKGWLEIADRRVIQAGIDRSPSLVYAVGGLPLHEVVLLQRVMPVMDTPWGPAAIAGGHRRRQALVDLVDQIIERERYCIERLRRSL